MNQLELLKHMTAAATGIHVHVDLTLLKSTSLNAFFQHLGGFAGSPDSSKVVQQAKSEPEQGGDS